MWGRQPCPAAAGKLWRLAILGEKNYKYFNINMLCIPPPGLKGRPKKKLNNSCFSLAFPSRRAYRALRHVKREQSAAEGELP